MLREKRLALKSGKFVKKKKHLVRGCIKAPTPIDWAKVDDMLRKGANGVEIAGQLGINNNTLYERCLEEHGTVFTVYSQSKRSKGDFELRDKYFELALKGNTQLLLSLGQERLGYGQAKNNTPQDSTPFDPIAEQKLGWKKPESSESNE